jgi:hypothetical protein
MDHAGRDRKELGRTNNYLSDIEHENSTYKEILMKDANMLLLVVEIGGAALFAIGAAFAVYWNLLGKKHRSLPKQLRIASKQQASHAGNRVLQPAFQLNRARYQQ